jgi:hypothetical protein
LDTLLEYLVLSYDIACQYSKNFWEHMQKFESRFHLNMEQVNIWYKVPNFRLPPHKWACHSPYSFHFMRGAGRTHGETVEQNWEFLNGVAALMKMMGPRARQAMLEDLLGFHNWRRTVSYRTVFMKHMAENVREGKKHQDTFDVFSRGLEQEDAALVESWRVWVREWESKQHKDATESPFNLTEKKGKIG